MDATVMSRLTDRLGLRFLHEVDRLVRLHAFGFLVIWPLLGAAAAGGWGPRVFCGIAVVTLCFNTFGALLNDVVDLPVDRTNPLRARDPLVRGTISRRSATLLALAQVPLIGAAHWAAGFPPSALGLVAAALLGMAAYDLWSKQLRVPPVIEGAQAAAGTLLAMYGAAVAGHLTAPTVWPVALSAGVFILFVNAFHGGLRDIENDRACGQRTTPIWLGCRGVTDGRVHITPAMSLYSTALQALLIGLAAQAAIGLGHGAGWLGIVAAASLGNLAVFVFEHMVRKPAWDLFLRTHVAIAALPLMLAFVPRLGPVGTALLFAMYCIPLLVLDRSHLTDRVAARPVEPQRLQMSPSR
jgi:4-hydroxybenzoate polyprenyltransferase